MILTVCRALLWFLFLGMWLVAMKYNKKEWTWVITGILFLLVLGFETIYYVQKRLRQYRIPLIQMNELIYEGKDEEDHMREVEERFLN
jgi:hypothetical protein